MIEVKLSFNSIDDAIAHLTLLKSPQVALPLEPAPAETSAKEPAKRGRKPKAEVVVEPMAAAPVEPTTPAAPVVKQTELVNAFRNLANAKGTDPVVALLKQYDAKNVVAIPAAQWRAAIEAAASAAGLTVEQAMATPPSSK